MNGAIATALQNMATWGVGGWVSPGFIFASRGEGGGLDGGVTPQPLGSL